MAQENSNIEKLKTRAAAYALEYTVGIAIVRLSYEAGPQNGIGRVAAFAVGCALGMDSARRTWNSLDQAYTLGQQADPVEVHAQHEEISEHE